jgi:integrase
MVKLTTLLAVYLSENPQLKSKTRKSKRWAFGHLVYHLGDKLVENLTVDDCHRFRSALLATGLQHSSVNIALREVAAVLEWAVVVKQILPANPMRQVKQLKTSRVITTFSVLQFWRMMDCASPIWRARLLAGRFGLRRGEVLNLTQNDFRDGYILVQPKRRTAETWQWEPKTGESRAVPLLDELARILPDGFYPMLSCRLYDNNLILQDKGLLTEERRECPDQNFDRDFRRLQMRTFGRCIGQFRDLRVTFVTASLEEGVPIHVVQRFAGHKSISTTMTYYTLVRQSFAESQREKLENSLKKGLPLKEEFS